MVGKLTGVDLVHGPLDLEIRLNVHDQGLNDVVSIGTHRLYGRINVRMNMSPLIEARIRVQK